jgi:hypothetical protein
LGSFLLSLLGSDSGFLLNVNLGQIEVLLETFLKLFLRSHFVSEEVGLSAEETEQVVEKVFNSLTLLHGVHEHAV